MTTTTPANRPYPLNAWYVAALSSEVDGENLFSRTLLDTGVMIFRRQDGTAVALRDRCPHRFVPLSMGKRNGDSVVCLYHGLSFNCSGECDHNPHGNQHIPAAARIQSYPLVERYGFLWIWMGDETANPDDIPDYGPLVDGHPNGVGYTYMYRQCNYELINDNVMDLSHIDHLHGEIITTRGQLSPQTPAITDSEENVSARWEWQQTPALLILNQFLPAPDASARHFIEIHWSAPANIQLSVGCTQDDQSPLDLKHCVGQYDLHTCTPETATTTHYFFGTRRNHLEDDAEFNQMKIANMHEAFVTEDGPVVDAVQQEMGTNDLFGLKPVLLPSDIAAVKVRRRLAALIEKEQLPQ
ncbi:aromatic ring-hydroxylating dioxygenase subunit alpha [Oceanobacter mangrovi]|uniref:aromatic ring-hydroxylating dioxygenase subunit alpha n=1 Tax=Oceanobacter mangrovi TaxID=2862510 RepID=UPI001C8DBF3D|nr:aromatic ring-hydroxylating dioxygenase subunit alpha [Oceanobacter mangrovi]